MIVVAYLWKEEKANCNCSKAPKEKTAKTKEKKSAKQVFESYQTPKMGSFWRENKQIFDVVLKLTDSDIVLLNYNL
jgi:hypothetical protein